MAFLCPSRLGRNKHKRGYQSMMRKLSDEGRLDTITLEDLVKLSWTTSDSRRIIMQNFTSCEAQEINVKQGQKVNYIYREGDWAYIVTDDKKEGFVPFIFLAKIGAPSKPRNKAIDSGTYTKKYSDLNPRNFSVESEETDHSGSDPADDCLISPGWSTDSGSVITVQDHPSVNFLKTESFEKVPMFYEVFLDERTNILHKNPLPSPGRSNDNEIPDNNNNQLPIQFKVMFNFKGLDVYDVSVKVGDIVELMDDSDPGWFLVRRSDGFEGYVPSNYIKQLSRPSARDLEGCDTNGNAGVSVSPNTSTINKDKTATNVIPTSWKVTTDLKGKSPIKTAHETFEESSKVKKQRPKKPPRKKKANTDGMSPRLDESIDSIDTFITESSAAYLDKSVNSLLDGLSPRSDDLSDSSVFDSSFNGVYGYKQCASNLSDMELSPRSLNVHSFDGSVSEDMTRNERLIKHMSKNERVDSYTVITKRDEKQESASNVRTFPCEMSDSFDSRSSYGGQRQKRPVSLPAFKSYQEYKKDYFDEYFYDDTDTKFANRSKHDVVNVAEILKMRNENKKSAHLKQKDFVHDNRNSENYQQKRKSSSTAKSQSHGKCDSKRKDANNPPKLKQFLLELPSTKIEKQKTNINRLSSMNNDDVENENMKRNTQEINSPSENLHKSNKARFLNEFNGHDQDYTNPEMYGYLQEFDTRKQRDKNTRQYNSSTDLRQIEAKSSTGNEYYEHRNQSGNVSSKKMENKQKKSHLRPYNSSTDLRDTGVKPDWSFGYPRRTRQSIGRHPSNDVTNSNRDRKSSGDRNCENKQETQDIARQSESIQNNAKQSIAGKSLNVQTKDSTEVPYNEESESFSFNDETMMALLNKTDNLLNKTDVLLHHDKKVRNKKQTANDLLKLNHPDQTRTSDNDVNKCTGSPVYHSNVETDAVDKCHLFLNSSTIGIHGMTYFVTSDNEKNGEKLSVDKLDGNINTEIVCNSLGSCQSGNSDSRKEKSSVIKDNSSKMVSEEIRSMDLQDIRGITEFVCQRDNDNENDDFLPIKYGEIVHIGLDGQDNGDKYWAFSPRLKKYGFVFKQNVKIPMVTII